MQTLKPFGFRPNFHTSGSANPRMKYGSVATPPTHSLFTGQPLLIDASGNFQPAATYTGPTPTAVQPVKAIFGGIEYSDQNGFVREQPQFLAGQPTFNSTATGVNNGNPYATFVKPYVYQDNQMEFMVQFNGTITKAAIGQTFDIDLTTLDTGNISGISQVALSTTPVAALGGNFIVTELAELPDNAWGDPFPVVMVKLNLTTF